MRTGRALEQTQRNRPQIPEDTKEEPEALQLKRGEEEGITSPLWSVPMVSSLRLSS